MPTTEINNYNLMIDGQNFSDQPVKNNIRTYNNILKIMTCQRDDQTTGCLLFNSYLNEHYKMITTDLSKQQALDADPNAIQQINFTGNLEQARNTIIFFIIEEAKETILDLSKGTVRVL